MRKIILITSILLLLIACEKKGTDLVITESPQEVKSIDTKVIYNNNEDKKPLKIITQNDSLKILVRADGAPGMYVDDKGEIHGFYVDLDVAIMEEMGQKYELTPYTDLGPTLQNLKSGVTHSALATPILPDYETFLQISIPFETLDYVIFLPSDSDEVIPSDKEGAIKTLFGKKIGAQTRGHIYQILRKYKEIEIIEYPTTTVAMEAMTKGEVDAVPEVKRVGLENAKINDWQVKPVGPSIGSLNIGTGFSKALDPSVLDRYNKALQKLIDNGYVDQLYQSYFGK